MRRLVIGAGHVGRRVAAMWRADGVVFATTRSPERAAELSGLGVKPLVCDVTAPCELPEVDVAAWCVGHDRASSAAMREVYVDGLVRTLAKLTCGKLVYASSTGVYGSRSEEWVDEASPTVPDDETGAICLDAEKLLRARRPDAVVLRLAGLYGPKRLIGRAQLEAGEAIEGGAGRWLNLVHVDDAAWAVVLAAEWAEPGSLYNVVDDRPLRRREYYELLARRLGTAPPRFAGGDGGAGRRVSSERIRDELGFRCYHTTAEKGLLGV